MPCIVCTLPVQQELLRRLVREMNYMANLPDAGKVQEMHRRRLVGAAFAEFIVSHLPPRGTLMAGATAMRLHEDMERQLRVSAVYAEAHPAPD